MARRITTPIATFFYVLAANPYKTDPILLDGSSSIHPPSFYVLLPAGLLLDQEVPNRHLMPYTNE